MYCIVVDLWGEAAWRWTGGRGSWSPNLHSSWGWPPPPPCPRGHRCQTPPGCCPQPPGLLRPRAEAEGRSVFWTGDSWWRTDCGGCSGTRRLFSSGSRGIIRDLGRQIDNDSVMKMLEMQKEMHSMFLQLRNRGNMTLHHTPDYATQ